MVVSHRQVKMVLQVLLLSMLVQDLLLTLGQLVKLLKLLLLVQQQHYLLLLQMLMLVAQLMRW